MNPTAPIGVFDSGLGGLTIVKGLFQALPHESIVYFGDLAHLPYGDKSPELIREYSSQIADFLLEQGVKAIVIACNTASAVAREAVRERAGRVPVLDVVQPASQMAIQLSSQQRIGIIGTKTTIRSGIYRRTILEQASNCQVVEKATPLLVPIIEEGWHNNSISREVIEAYMSDTGFLNIDTLILGCTHYPLIREQIQAYFQRNHQQSVEVIDSSQAVARQVAQKLSDLSLLNPGAGAEHRYFVSDFTQNFLSSAERFLNQEVTFQKVSL